MPSTSDSGRLSGRTSESSAARGDAPIAARSLRFTASALWPIASGGEKRRSKCTPSTRASVVITSSAPRSGSMTAASSPGPTITHDGDARRELILRISSRSPITDTVGAISLTLAPSALFRVFDSPCFANDRDLDLSGVLQLVLDAPGDVLRQPDRFLVGDLLALDQDPDLTSGLERERLRHPLERIGDVFELLEAPDVGLEDVAPGAGPGRGDRVGGLHEHCLERRPVDIHVMGGDRQYDRLALPVLAQQIHAELEMRPFHLAIDRLADVVEERRPCGDVLVDPELARHEPGEERDLLRVTQDVLPVTRAVLQFSHQPEDLGVDVVQAELERGRGAVLPHLFLHF